MTRRQKNTLQPTLPSAHFRVYIDEREIGVQSISPLQGVVTTDKDASLCDTVTLRRAVTRCRRLFKWYRNITRGRSDAREVKIVQLDAPQGEALNVWVLKGASPVRWTGPAFDAMGSGYALEELELRYDSIAWRRQI